MKKRLLSFALCLALALSVILPAVSVLAVSGGTYDANTTYYAGDSVTYNGVTYTAKWYTRGDTPGTAGSPWERAPELDANGVPVWYEGMAVLGGNRVSHNGTVYTAKWWTTSEPGTDASWEGGADPVIPDDPAGPADPVVPDEPDDPADPADPVTPDEPDGPADPGAWSASKVYFRGDTVIYNGETYTAKYYSVGEAPDTSGAWERPVRYDENGIPIWYEGMVCTGGTSVSHNGTVYTAQWWTTSEPGTDAAWGGTQGSGSGDPADPVPVDPNGPIRNYSDYTVDESLVSAGDSSFKTIGYFPFYSSYWADNIDYDSLTHIIYAFAFPDGQGGLQPLDDVALVQKLIREGHAHGVKVLLGVGGWAYYGTVMEYQFDGCTATPELTEDFTDAIVALVEQYGFDGVDMDWEHPRNGTSSWSRYEAMMIRLREKLGSGKLLTAAVLSGVTTGGVEYYDAAAHTANVMAVCDWFSVMAYDCTCTLEFCGDVADYWCVTRGMPVNKVCMGVPFYSYPGWSAYSALVGTYGNAAVNGDMDGANYHNGIPTMQAKTRWAKEYGLGGMMIWELSQDTADPATSLLRAIADASAED